MWRTEDDGTKTAREQKHIEITGDLGNKGKFKQGNEANIPGDGVTRGNQGILVCFVAKKAKEKPFEMWQSCSPAPTLAL